MERLDKNNLCSKVGASMFIIQRKFNNKFQYYNYYLYILMLVHIRKVQSFTFPLILKRFSENIPHIDPSKNYYQTLNVPKNAGPTQIKKNYYELAKKYHPDAAQGKQEEFKLIFEAYSVLSSPEFRKRYDALRPNVSGSQQEEYVEGEGPYRTKEDYTNKAKAMYYEHSKAEWSRIRRGLRSQSRNYYENESTFRKGATGDTEILKFYMARKQREWKDQADRNLHMEYIQKLKEKDEEFRQKHKERLAKVKEEEEQKRKQQLKKTFIGRILYRILVYFDKAKK